MEFITFVYENRFNFFPTELKLSSLAHGKLYGQGDLKLLYTPILITWFFINRTCHGLSVIKTFSKTLIFVQVYHSSKKGRCLHDKQACHDNPLAVWTTLLLSYFGHQ